MIALFFLYKITNIDFIIDKFIIDIIDLLEGVENFGLSFRLLSVRFYFAT